MNDLFIRPVYDEAAAIISFTADSAIGKINYTIFDGNGIFRRGETASGDNQIKFKIDMSGFIPWSVELPHLYTLELVLSNGEKISQRFGMTKISVENRVLYFNDIPLYVRGHIRGREAHDHPNFLGCSNKEYYEKNINWSKEYGFNFVRFHSRIPSEDFLNAADELGYLCQVEIRPYYGHYQKKRQSTGFDSDTQLVEESYWEEMILKLRNHPCVLIYCMGNEINSPGNNERVKIISALTKKLDDTRLFLDTCSRGEYDRDTVDIDVQHMSYFAPYGKHADMFDDSMHTAIYGSVNKVAMAVNDGKDGPAWELKREIPLKFPLLAHEVCHYNVLRDPYSLKKKFAAAGIASPWWIEELIKMIHAKGHDSQFEKMLKASSHFQYIWMKQCLESVRKSPILQGFQMLQFSDTDVYENANGLLDCFDDPKNIPASEFQKFNGSTVIIADLPTRTYWAGEKITVPVFISHFTPGLEKADLRWCLDGCDETLGGVMKDFDLKKRGNRKLARLLLTLPEIRKPCKATLKFELLDDTGEILTENQWPLWLFPNRAEKIAPMKIASRLNGINLNKRYPQIDITAHTAAPQQLMLANRFDETVFDELAAGRDVLMLYRVQENRDRHRTREKYYLPSTWERLKGIIWDRGHNCGGFFREHAVLRDFPHDEYIDWQMYDLIEDCDKIVLDDFPVKIQPIIEGVDKAVRDRFDVGRFDIPEFQYEYTMRKFGYLFELKVGDGRLLIAGLNFAGIETHQPATCYLFENILNYVTSGEFCPAAKIDVDDFKKYLAEKGCARRIKERMMTQYWQLDDSPLESKKYWAESEAWLREDEVKDPNGYWAYGKP